MSKARERFNALKESGYPLEHLAEMSLCVAAEFHPYLNVASSLYELELITMDAQDYVDLNSEPQQSAEQLCRYLHDIKGFRGNQENYYDPQNSFLNIVLKRRLGIPITLAVIYISVGRGMGLAIEGINFPEHFLVALKPNRAQFATQQHAEKSKASAMDDSIIIDPFSGELLFKEDCQKRLNAINTPHRLNPDHLTPISGKAMLLRIVANLKMAYLARKEYENALKACDTVLDIAPESHIDIRDRAMILEELGCTHAAIHEFERLLGFLPQAQFSQAIEKRISKLKGNQSLPIH